MKIVHEVKSIKPLSGFGVTMKTAHGELSSTVGRVISEMYLYLQMQTYNADTDVLNNVSRHSVETFEP